MPQYLSPLQCLKRRKKAPCLLGYAPLELAKKLGMHLQELDSALATVLHLEDATGVLVAFVEPGSRAEHGGLRRDDLITRVNGQGNCHLTRLPRNVTR